MPKAAQIPIILIKEDWINESIDIQESPNGLGMFACDNLKKESSLVVFGCKYTNKSGAVIAKKQGFYVKKIDEDLFSYESPGEYNSWYINHSCEPNAGMSEAFTLVAMKDITVGDEITMDYAMLDSSLEAFECNCGSKSCRRRLGMFDWKKNDLQKKYKGYFTPYLAKKIKEDNRAKKI